MSACRTKLVGELLLISWQANLVGTLAGILRDFSDPQNKGPTSFEKFRSAFRKKFLNSNVNQESLNGGLRPLSSICAQLSKTVRKEKFRHKMIGNRGHLWTCTLSPRLLSPHFLGCRKWGCNKWGFKGCLASRPGNRPKSAFFGLFLPFSAFSGGPEQHRENPENGGKRPFSLDILGFA